MTLDISPTAVWLVRASVSLLVLAALCVVAPGAFAFEQTMTCTESGLYACDAGEQPKPVHWPHTCVSFHINEEGTENIADVPKGLSDELETSVIEAFRTWDDVDCSAMQLIYAGQTANDAAEVKKSSGAVNMNLVVWRDDNWTSVASRQAFALTSVTFDPRNGRIVDADVELNTDHYVLSVASEPQADHVDLLNTLVHEVGHFIGLDHTPVRDATMYASAAMGETSKRQLHDDDIAGLCHIYAVGDTPNSCTLEEAVSNAKFKWAGSGSGDDSGGPGSGRGGYAGCASAPLGHPGALAWLAAVLCVLVGLRVRARWAS